MLTQTKKSPPKKASLKSKKIVSKTVKNSHLLKKETTWDLNTLTGQLVAQLVYCTSSLIEDRDEKHVEEIIKLITIYKKRVKTYRKDDSNVL